MKKKYSFLLFFIIFIFCLVPLQPRAQQVPARLQIVIKGVNQNIFRNIQAYLEVEEKKLSRDPSTEEVKEFFSQSKKRIQEAIAPYGYFSPEIQSQLMATYPQGWLLKFTISLGKPVLIRKLDLQLKGEGANNRKLEAYIQNQPLHSNEVFESATYEKVKEKLYNIANEEGYIKASFDKAQVSIYRGKRVADIILYFNTHERYYFGALSFNQTSYAPAFLERFNIFHPSDPFSSEKLIQYQQDMNDTSYFKHVLVVPELDKIKEKKVPIQVSIVPPKARRYYFGIGYGSFTGPRLISGIHFNRVNQYGHSADLQFKLSSVLTGFAAKYYIPGRKPLYEQWLLGFDQQKFKPKNGDSFSRSISLGYQYKRKPWGVVGNVNYLIERYTAFNSPTSTSDLLYPSLSVSYIKADNAILPTEGKSFNVLFQGASQHLYSSTSFIQGDLKAKYYFTPFQYGNFILRGEFGYTVVHELSDLPLSMRFFTGGVSTLRGYPDSSIGPGRYLELASIEYQHHLTENWLVAFFYDVGTATNQFGTPLYKGDGVGLIYRSPIGPIRVYLATALSKPNHPYQVEFSMGPEF